MKTASRPKKSSREPLAVFAYKAIARRIVCLEYEPSQHLEENQLIRDLGIGRTPIREALVRLQGEKLVESHPNRGMIVRPITLQNTRAMFESMSIFESGAAEVSVTKDCSQVLQKLREDNAAMIEAIKANDIMTMVEANHTFHMHYARASQNEFLIRAIQEVRTEAKRLSYLSYSTRINQNHVLEEHYATVIEEHEGIIATLESKDLPALKELLKKHVQTFRDRIIKFMVM